MRVRLRFLFGSVLALWLGWGSVGCRDGHFEKRAEESLLPIELTLRSSKAEVCPDQERSEFICFLVTAEFGANQATSESVQISATSVEWAEQKLETSNSATWVLSGKAFLPFSGRGQAILGQLLVAGEPLYRFDLRLEESTSPMSRWTPVASPRGRPATAGSGEASGEFRSVYAMRSRTLDANQLETTVRFEAELARRFSQLKGQLKISTDETTLALREVSVDSLGMLPFDLPFVRAPFNSEEDFVLSVCIEFSFDEICAVAILNFERDPLRPLIASSRFQSRTQGSIAWPFERFSSPELQPLLLTQHGLELRAEGIVWRSTWGIGRDTRVGFREAVLSEIELVAKVYALNQDGRVILKDHIQFRTIESGVTQFLMKSLSREEKTRLWAQSTHWVFAVSAPSLPKAREWNLFCASGTSIGTQHPLSCEWQDLPITLQADIRGQ